jgi:hypothetical protein
MRTLLDRFREIWLVDFEFQADPGERQVPVCLVGWELRSGRKIRLWRDEMGISPPYSVEADSLFIAYYASAELGCHVALGWPMPARVLDLFVEFRNLTNGRETVAGNSLLGALAHYGLDGIAASEKEEMRELIMCGGPWTAQKQLRVLDYCETDVAAMARLFPVMLPQIDLRRALYRGRYMASVARMEAEGVPIDTELLSRLRANWIAIQDRLIGAVDSDYHIFEGRTFKLERFEQWLAGRGIPWPRLESGQLDLSRETFRSMARIYPEVSPLRELRHTLSELRLNDLAVGHDGRNRCLLSPFRARTSRNCPSNSRFIFGPSVWLRSLIQPPPGHGLAYIDWCQQEFGIAAALSGDPNMLTAYRSGDPYLEFAKQAHAVPPDATKETFGAVREQYKQNALGVNYGMGERSLAGRIGELPIVARHLLELHHEIYRQFWNWSECCVNHAMLCGWQTTVFGWVDHIFPNPNPRSLRNFPMQANGAEILRLACCLGTENGIRICAPVHDAVLILAPIERLGADIAAMRHYMAEASSIVLAGFRLETDYRTVLYPDHYSDPRGQTMFAKVMSLL